tara:strand:+ start:327 stop:650 length:324 start_codon:yes stop_codon:yes gene_type:complete
MKPLYVRFKNETESRLLQELAFSHGKEWHNHGREFLSVPSDDSFLVIYKNDSCLCHGHKINEDDVVSVKEWIEALKNWPSEVSLTVNGKKIEVSLETKAKILEAIGE